MRYRGAETSLQVVFDHDSVQPYRQHGALLCTKTALPCPPGHAGGPSPTSDVLTRASHTNNSKNPSRRPVVSPHHDAVILTQPGGQQCRGTAVPVEDLRL